MIVPGSSNAALTVVAGFACHQVYHKTRRALFSGHMHKLVFLKGFLNDTVLQSQFCSRFSLSS